MNKKVGNKWEVWQEETVRGEEETNDTKSWLIFMIRWSQKQLDCKLMNTEGVCGCESYIKKHLGEAFRTKSEAGKW